MSTLWKFFAVVSSLSSLYLAALLPCFRGFFVACCDSFLVPSSSFGGRLVGKSAGTRHEEHSKNNRMRRKWSVASLVQAAELTNETSCVRTEPTHVPLARSSMRSVSQLTERLEEAKYWSLFLEIWCKQSVRFHHHVCSYKNQWRLEIMFAQLSIWGFHEPF